MTMINLTIPIYNGEKTLESKIGELTAFLDKRPYGRELFLVLSNNCSTDSTGEICESLISKHDLKIIHHYIPLKGKGRAIKESWQSYPADQHWFMDMDLSTRLESLDEMHDLLDKYHIVIGSRFLKESRVTRSLKRKIISKGYNALLDMAFKKKFSDAQCGFKGVTSRVVEELIPKIKSNDFFFDTELLILAEREGYSIKEIPVCWVEDEHSTVKLYRDIPKFLRHTAELYNRLR